MNSTDASVPAMSGWAGIAVLGAFGFGCVPPARMCASEGDCGPQSACVASRCLGHGGVAAIATSRRLLYTPVDEACVRRGDGAGPPPVVATVGGPVPSVILLRFAVDLPADVNVIEAYLLLERATAVDVDPTPIVLHVERVTEPWDGKSVSWAHQPHLDDVGAPIATVRAVSGRRDARLDVRSFVQRWARRGRDEFGIALVAQGESATGVTLVLTPGPGASDLPGPRLELYVK